MDRRLSCRQLPINIIHRTAAWHESRDSGLGPSPGPARDISTYPGRKCLKFNKKDTTLLLIEFGVLAWASPGASHPTPHLRTKKNSPSKISLRRVTFLHGLGLSWSARITRARGHPGAITRILRTQKITNQDYSPMFFFPGWTVLEFCTGARARGHAPSSRRSKSEIYRRPLGVS